jgi:hypothetical protein
MKLGNLLVRLGHLFGFRGFYYAQERRAHRATQEATRRDGRRPLFM